MASSDIIESARKDLPNLFCIASSTPGKSSLLAGGELEDGRIVYIAYGEGLEQDSHLHCVGMGNMYG